MRQYLTTIAAAVTFGLIVSAGCGGGGSGGVGTGATPTPSGPVEPPAGAKMKVIYRSQEAQKAGNGVTTTLILENVPSRYADQIFTVRLGANSEYTFGEGRMRRNPGTTAASIDASGNYDPAAPMGVELPITVIAPDNVKSIPDGAVTFRWNSP